MKNIEQKPAQQETEAFTVGSFRPEDAQGISDLFRSVYGEHYPIRLFYDPQAIVAANRDGSYHSICARTASGQIIGVNHLYRSAPNPALYESGAGLVLSEYRNSGANKATLDYLFNTFIPQNPHIEAVFGEAVCNHPYMQRAVGTFHFVETAIEVALMPAEAYTQEKSAAGRVATLNASRTYQAKPHRIFLPPVYETQLGKIYDRFDDTRDRVLSVAAMSGGTLTKAELTVFDFAQVARIAVSAIGANFQDRLAALEAQALEKNVLVFQVWLKLTEPCVGAAVDGLRAKGYFFGGPVPRWFDGDGLLMQKLLCAPGFEGIVLFSDFAKELLEFIKADWQQTRVDRQT